MTKIKAPTADTVGVLFRTACGKFPAGTGISRASFAAGTHKYAIFNENIIDRGTKSRDGRFMRLPRAVVHLALIALFARAFVPAGWMPSDESAAPLVPCSLSQISDRTEQHPAPDQAPDKGDGHSHDNFCAFGTSPGVAAPDHTIFYTPVLQGHDDLEDDTTTPVRSLHHGHAPQVPRATPQLPLI